MNAMAPKVLDTINLGCVAMTQHDGGPGSGHIRRAAAVGADASRWYCVQTERARETEVRDRLEDQGFGAFLPLVIVLRPVRPGIMQATTRAAFPGYAFVRFSVETARWRSVIYTRGVKGLFSSAPDRPTPVPQGQMDVLFAAGFDRPMTEDPRPALIAAGAKVRVTEGPFTDHEGVCLLDDRERIELLLTMFGRRTPVTLTRRAVEPAG